MCIYSVQCFFGVSSRLLYFTERGVFVTKIEVIVALIILLIVSSEGRKSWIAIREIGAGFGL